VCVVDDGPGAADRRDTTPTGHGIAGMRERVAMLGGQLDAVRQARGGFLVRARLPLAAPR
jgi:signal transduction histidine kinase